MSTTCWSAASTWILEMSWNSAVRRIVEVSCHMKTHGQENEHDLLVCRINLNPSPLHCENSVSEKDKEEPGG